MHEEEEDQNSLFVEGSNTHFTFEEDKDENILIKSEVTPAGGESIQNPFKDNLFNSENLPQTVKLNVEINDDYMARFTQKEPEPISTHSENIMKRRKNKGKKHNISMHQLDDDTRKQMEEAIEKERQAMMKEESDALAEKSKSASLLVTESNEMPELALTQAQKLSMSAPVEVVENHFPTVQKKDETEDDDNLNDREPEIANLQILDEPEEIQIIEEEDIEEDNILRKPSASSPPQFQNIEDKQEEQESIEIIDKEDEEHK